jgi:branched-subunit amino acid transport protein
VSVWSALAITVMVGAMTYSMRAIVIVALADRPIPAPLERALRNVGPAVLAALAINLAAGGDGGPHLEWAEAAALVVAGAVAVWRRNILWTLAAGMATLLVVVAVT